MTNVARHADARTVDLSLSATAGGDVMLRVRDDGHGIAGHEANGSGTGIAGMRERALLIGGRLAVSASPGGGTEVNLTVPVGGAR